MKHINYGREPIHSDDDLVDLVLEYAKRLAMNNTSDNVTIPYRTATGEESQITLLLGPASEITAAEDPGDVPPLHLDTSGARADLERRIQRFDQADAVFDPDWGSAFQGAFDLEDPAAVDGAAKPHDD